MRIHSKLFALFLAVDYSSALVTNSNARPGNSLQRQSNSLLASTADTAASSPSGAAAYEEVDFQAYSNGFKTVFAELPSAECTPTIGKIPKDLKGTYYRNGPAMFSAGSIVPPKTSIIQPRDGPPVPDGQVAKRMVEHPFEGDGGILAVTFDGEGDSATARYRYVRTIAFTNERRKGQRLYRGMDSTRELGPSIGEGLGNDLHTPLFRHHLLPGLNKFRKNTSNSRTIYWGRRLLSMWEGGQPYKMDALALSTEGRSQLGGVLKEPDPFGCKMVVDPKQNRAVMYSIKQSVPLSEVTVFEFNDKFRLVEENGGKQTQSLPGVAMISDMAATENFAVFVQPPVSAGMQFLLNKEPGKVLKVENKPSMLHLVPRVRSRASAKSIEIPFDGVVEAGVELVNAYEDGDLVILDAIRSDGSGKPSGKSASKWPWAATRAEYEVNSSKKSLWRYTVNVKSESVTKELLTNQQCFFGTISPNQSTQKHSSIYMALGGLGEGVAPPQGVGRFDTETRSMDSWMPQNFEFCGEPMFARRENPTSEDDGYILSVLFNGKEEQSELLVFESTKIPAGPIARIPLGIGIPHGLHGCFTDAEEAIWSGEEIERRAKLADKMESRGNLWNEVKSDFSGLGLRFDDMEEYFGDSFLS